MSIERRKKYHKYAKIRINIHYVFNSIDKVLYKQKNMALFGANGLTNYRFSLFLSLIHI